MKIFLLLTLVSVCLADVPVKQDLQTDAIKNLFATGKFNSYVRPNGYNSTENPVVVKVSLHILSLDNIRTSDGSFDLQMFFREEWVDDRLKFDDKQGKLKQILLNEAHALWTPDLFFVNEKTGHVLTLMKPNHFLRIMPDGTILYSTRIGQSLSCPMDLRNFPFDEQVCSVNIESYGYNVNDVELQWINDNPVSYSIDRVIPEFSLKQIHTSTERISLKSATYSRLTMDIMLKRDPQYYLLQVFIPSVSIIILSWLSFFIKSNKVAARSIMVSLPLLMMMLLDISNRDVLPKLPYKTALDMWNGVCMTFSFAALVEFVIVHFRQKKDECEDSQESDKKEKNAETQSYKLLITKLRNHNGQCDYLARIIYPILFVFFNIVYWSVYL